MSISKQPLAVPTLNGHTLIVVPDGDLITLRIAKDGHNRGIAKLDRADFERIAAFLSDE